MGAIIKLDELKSTDLTETFPVCYSTVEKSIVPEESGKAVTFEEIKGLIDTKRKQKLIYLNEKGKK